MWMFLRGLVQGSLSQIMVSSTPMPTALFSMTVCFVHNNDKYLQNKTDCNPRHAD